jgi:hypothetical protein
MPDEQRLNNPAASETEQKFLNKFKVENVLMERSYLNAWRKFQKHAT